jgi:hypothetical protein
VGSILHRQSLAAFIACSILAAGCARPPVAAADVTVEWKLTPAPISGRPSRGELLLFDRSHHPVRGARLQVEGHMSHPGMAPIAAPASEREDGAYVVRLQFTMDGDWTVRVTGVLADGRRISRALAVANVSRGS